MTLDMKTLMEKAKEMQEKMQEAQDKVTKIVVVGEAGGGMIKVHMNGLYKVLRVEIDPSVVGNKEDIDMLSDLFAAATNNAVKRIEEETKKEMMTFSKDMQLELPEEEES